MGGAPAAAATTSALLDLGVAVVMYSPGRGSATLCRKQEESLPVEQVCHPSPHKTFCLQLTADVEPVAMVGRWCVSYAHVYLVYILTQVYVVVLGHLSCVQSLS